MAAAQLPDEPKYEGKSIIYWCEKFQKADNDKDRHAAEKAIIAFGPDAESAVLGLLIMLDDRSETYREQVANMLCAIGPAAKGAVADLIKLLEEKSPRDPHQVIRVLCAIGPDAKDAIPAIRRVTLAYLTAKPGEIRYSLWNFSNHGSQFYDYARLGPDAVPMLLDVIETPDTRPVPQGQVRPMRLGAVNAFDALRDLGAAGKAAAPRLTKLLKHDRPDFRLEAATTLWAVDKNPAGIPVLITLLKADDRRQAMSAAEALGAIGPQAKDALAELKALVPKEAPTERNLPVLAPAGYFPNDDIRALGNSAREAIQRIESEPKK
jgi:HEAT repeat protein